MPLHEALWFQERLAGEREAEAKSIKAEAAKGRRGH
jgi:hypothetical protein